MHMHVPYKKGNINHLMYFTLKSGSQNRFAFVGRVGLGTGGGECLNHPSSLRAVRTEAIFHSPALSGDLVFQYASHPKGKQTNI